MREAYLKLRLLRLLLTESSDYSETPDGDLDLDRLIASKPAFKVISDTHNFKQKKIILNGLFFHSGITSQEIRSRKIKIFMLLRQMISDGFEIYQYNTQGDLNLLTSYTVSEIFMTERSLTAKDSDTVQRDIKKIQKDVIFDDIEIVTIEKLLELAKQLPEEAKAIYTSDVVTLNLSRDFLKEMLDTGNIKVFIENILGDIYETDHALGINWKKFIQSAKLSQISLDVYPKNIERLEIDDPFLVGDFHDVYILLSKMPKIRELIFKNNNLFNVNKLCSLKLKDLEHIEISSSCSIEDIKKIIKNFRKLKSLKIENKELDLSGETLSFNELNIILNGIKKTVESISIILNKEFFSVLSRNTWLIFSNLVELDLKDSKFTGKELLTIAEYMPCLSKVLFSQSELDLTGIMINHRLFSAILNGSENLKKITISYVYGLLNYHLIRMKINLPNVEEIDFTTSYFNLEDILIVIRHAPNLKKIVLSEAQKQNLDLSKIQNLSSKEIYLILSGAPELKKLEIKSDENFSIFLKECKYPIVSIEHLVVSDEIKSLEVFNDILEKFPNLKSLSIQLSSDVVFTKKLFNSVVLESLKIENIVCSPEKIRFFLEGMPELKKISLSIDSSILFINDYVNAFLMQKNIIDIHLNKSDVSFVFLVSFIQRLSHVEIFRHELHDLDLSNSRIDRDLIDKETFRKLLEHNHHFLKIKLSNPEHIQQFFQSVQDGLVKLDNLQEIDFCDNALTDEQFDFLEMAAPNIEEIKSKNQILDLRGYENLSQRKLLLLLRNSSQCQKIFFGKNKITSKVLEYLISREFSSCDEISFSGNSLEAKYIISIIEKMPRLKKISHDIIDIKLEDVKANNFTWKLLFKGNEENIRSIELNSCYDRDYIYLNPEVSGYDCNFVSLEKFTANFSFLLFNDMFKSMSKLTELDFYSYTIPRLKNSRDVFLGLETKKLTSLNIIPGFFEESCLNHFLNNAKSLKILNLVYVQNEIYKNVPLSEDAKRADVIRADVISEIEFLAIDGEVDDKRERLLLDQVKKIRKIRLKDVKISFHESLVDHTLENMEQFVLLRTTITAEQLLDFLKKCPNLTEIMILRNNITGSDIAKEELSQFLADFSKKHTLTDLENDYLALERSNKLPPPKVTVASASESEARRELESPMLGDAREVPAEKQESGSEGEQSQKPHTAESHEICDANTSFKDTTFDINRIFYAVGASGRNPEPSDYRLSVYDFLKIKTIRCSQEDAFLLKNLKDLKLESCTDTLSFSSTDVYQEAIRLQQEKKNTYFYAKTRLHLSDQWQALPSLNSDEMIRKMHLEPTVSVEVKYSKRDNLYYIRSTDKCGEISVDVDYCVETPSDKKTMVSEAIQKLANYCSDFHAAPLDMKKYDAPTGQDYLIEMARQKVGACRHRSVIFKALLENAELRNSIPELAGLEFSAINVRIINNASHSYVEIEENGAWVKYDLGGYPAKENINDENNPLLKKENVEAIDEYTVDKNSDVHEIAELLKNANHLKKLSIDSSFSLQGLIEGPVLLHLESLDLGNRALTIAEMEALLRNLPNLKEIHFERCSFFSDEIIYTVPPAIDEEQHSVRTIPVSAIRDYFPTIEKRIEKNSVAYVQSIFSRDESKRLIECSDEQVAGLAYHLQHYCQHSGKRYCYIHSPEELILRKPYLELQKDNSGKIKKGLNGRVYDALSDKKSPVIFIINFANFSAHDLARFNSILDKEPNIDGEPLSKNAKVVGIIDSAGYKDASLYSRFGEAIEACSVPSDNMTVSPCFSTNMEETAEQAIIEIDFFDISNWEAILIGAWSVKGDNLHFNPGILVRLLENKTPLDRIVLKNPPLNDPDFTRFFQEASLRGCIEYQGRRLMWPSPVLSVKNALAFSVDQIVLAQVAHPLPDATVINPNTFSRLIKQYSFIKNGDQQNGQLFEEAGILEKNKAETLSLYVSESLSDSQWSLLLHECKKNGVKLNICLAANVKLPSALNKIVQSDIPTQKRVPLETFNAGVISESDCCIISDDQDVTLSALRENIDNTIFIDISELSSSDLLIRLKGGFEQNTTENNEENLSLAFFQENGVLLKALEKSQKVVLHGNFTPELRQRLQVFLFERKQTKPSLGQVILVSDQKTGETFDVIAPVLEHTVSPEEKKAALIQYGEKIFPGRTLEIPPEIYEEDSPYVTQQALLRHHFSLASKEDTYVGLKTALPPYYQSESDFDLATAEKQTVFFNKARLEAVEKTLQVSPFVFLAGMTGVGKTSFVEKVWKNDALQRSLYVGEKQLLQWSKDHSPGVKAIFIDEANITTNNWSQFEGLFHNKPPGMVINGEYVVLSDHHKVIFAGNPATYSDDRRLPSLFERHGNSILFDPLSPAYIFHEILQPLFKSDHEIVMAEDISRPILMLYQYLNGLSKEEVLLTPRELRMMVQLSLNYLQDNPTENPEAVSKYFAYELSRQFVPEAELAKFNEKFSALRPLITPRSPLKEGRITITASNKPSAEILNDFLILRKSHIASDTKLQAPGLGGVVFEGEPGLGKSELAVACLKAQGLHRRSLDAIDVPTDQNYFYFIPAAADPKIKREILLRAFHEGAVVVYDEINTSTAQEDLLNRLLMGKDPESKDPKKAGFMLIGTQNPTTMAGRAKTSNALLHRMHYRVIPHYTTPEMQMILKEMGLPERRINALIEQYQKASSEKKAACFRDVITRAEEDIRALLGKKSEDIKKTDLLVIVNSLTTNSEQLEAVFRHRLCDDEIKLALVKNDQLSEQLLETIFSEKENSFYDKIIPLLMCHPNTSEKILIKLVPDLPSEEIILTLLKHRHANSDFIATIIERTSSPSIFDVATEHPACTDTLLKIILKKTEDVLLFGRIARKENISADVLFSILEKKYDFEIFDIVLKHKNCNSGILEKIISLSSNENVINTVALHSKANESVLLAILNSDSKTKEQTIKLILLNPHCDSSVLIKLLDKTEDFNTIKNIISHQSSDNALLKLILRKTNKKEWMTVLSTNNPDLIEMCLKKLHKSSSLPSLDDMIKNIPHILPRVLPYLKNEELLMLAKKIDDPSLLNRISEKLNASAKEDLKKICLERDVEKDFDKEVFSKALASLTGREDYAPVLIKKIIEKSDDIAFLMQIVQKQKVFPSIASNKIFCFIVEKLRVFYRAAKTPEEKEIFDSLLVVASKSLTRLDQLLELVRMTDNDIALYEILKKLTELSSGSLDDNNIVCVMAAKTKDNALLSMLLDFKIPNYLELIEIVLPKAKDDELFLKICMSKQAVSSSHIFQQIVQNTNSAIGLQQLLLNYYKRNYYCYSDIAYCQEAFLKMASAPDCNNDILNYIYRHKECEAETLTKIFKNRIDECFSSESLLFILNDNRFYESLSRVKKTGFFEKKIVSEGYPTCAILAALLFVKLNYHGEHANSLSQLLQTMKSISGTVAMTAKIKELVDSGNIGKMGGSGRLRKALSEIIDAVKNNKPVNTDDILKVLGNDAIRKFEGR